MYSSHVALLLMQNLCCLVCQIHMLALAHLTDLEEDFKETAACRWSLPGWLPVTSSGNKRSWRQLEGHKHKGHSSKGRQHTCRIKARSMSNLADHMASCTHRRAGQLARPVAGCSLPSHLTPGDWASVTASFKKSAACSYKLRSTTTAVATRAVGCVQGEWVPKELATIVLLYMDACYRLRRCCVRMCVWPATGCWVHLCAAVATPSSAACWRHSFTHSYKLPHARLSLM
jgi:hypothetical protein